MNTPIPPAWSARFVVLLLAAMLLPLSAEAQPKLVVTPPSVSAQTNAGTNAPSQTVQVRKSGSGALRWSVVPPSASWLSVSPTSGTNAGTLTLTFQTSGLAAGQHQTSFRVDSNGGAATVPVQMNIVGSAPPLTVTCPANISVASSNGSPVVVTYSVSTSGGVAPVTVTGSPASGSSFEVGTTTVDVNAKSNDGQTASCTFSVTVTYSPPPPPGDWTFCASENQFCAFSGTRQVRYGANDTYFIKTLTGGTSCTNEVFGDPIYGSVKHCDVSGTVSQSGVGPQAAITCPTGAVDIFPGTSIQTVVTNHPVSTTFCLRAGVHSLSSSITPKSGDTFVGEYGAIIDGSGWTTSDDSEAAFRAHNQDIDSVTIRNLVIRNLRRGIHAFGSTSDHWTVDNNEIGPNYHGLVFPSYSLIRNNYIHHNSYGGYLGPSASNSLLENNEIASNGWEQKIGESANVTFRNNFVHHNAGEGIWYDDNNTGALIEGNRVEDNGEMGIFYEISSNAVIRNNTIRRSGDTAVFISTSKNVEIYNNIIENNFRGITYFVNCHSVGGGTIPGGFDLADNWAHDNTVVVDTRSGAFASVFSYTLCEPAQLTPYQNGQKNLRYSHNVYDVPSPTTVQYWFWNGLKYWNEWQALGQDLDSVAQ